jgi:hypothetical protein
MTAEFLWMNIPLMVLFFALWVGIPVWMIYRRPDRHPRETRTVPAYMRQQMSPALPARRWIPARVRVGRREAEVGSWRRRAAPDSGEVRLPDNRVALPFPVCLDSRSPVPSARRPGFTWWRPTADTG